MTKKLQIGDRIRVKGKVLSIQPSKYPAPPNSIAIDADSLLHIFEGIVEEIKADGEIDSFRATKIMNLVSNTVIEPTYLRVSIIDLEDCEIERLSS